MLGAFKKNGIQIITILPIMPACGWAVLSKGYDIVSVVFHAGIQRWTDLTYSLDAVNKE